MTALRTLLAATATKNAAEARLARARTEPEKRAAYDALLKASRELREAKAREERRT